MKQGKVEVFKWCDPKVSLTGQDCCWFVSTLPPCFESWLRRIKRSVRSVGVSFVVSTIFYLEGGGFVKRGNKTFYSSPHSHCHLDCSQTITRIIKLVFHNESGDSVVCGREGQLATSPLATCSLMQVITDCNNIWHLCNTFKCSKCFITSIMQMEESSLPQARAELPTGSAHYPTPTQGDHPKLYLINVHFNFNFHLWESWYCYLARFLFSYQFHFVQFVI